MNQENIQYRLTRGHKGDYDDLVDFEAEMVERLDLSSEGIY